MSNSNVQTTKVVTGKVRLSYANIWEPRAVEEGQPAKYGSTILIDKTDTKTLKAIESAVAAATADGVARLWGGKKPGLLKTPLRDGDAEKPDSPEYKGKMFLNATSTSPIGVVDRGRNTILDRAEIYSGVYVLASLNFYPFNKKSNGIAAGLNNIMKHSDGERLAGRANATADFADVVIEDDGDDLL